MSLALNLRKIALKNALSNDIEVYIDRAYRHYSKTYNTALHLAYEVVTQEEALLIYMEDQMADYSEEDLKERLAELVEPKTTIMIEPPKYKNPRIAQMGDDEAWIMEMNAKLRKEDEAKKRQADLAAKELEEKATKAINDLASNVSKMLKD